MQSGVKFSRRKLMNIVTPEFVYFVRWIFQALVSVLGMLLAVVIMLFMLITFVPTLGHSFKLRTVMSDLWLINDRPPRQARG